MRRLFILTVLALCSVVVAGSYVGGASETVIAGAASDVQLLVSLDVGFEAIAGVAVADGTVALASGDTAFDGFGNASLAVWQRDAGSSTWVKSVVPTPTGAIAEPGERRVASSGSSFVWLVPGQIWPNPLTPYHLEQATGYQLSSSSGMGGNLERFDAGISHLVPGEALVSSGTDLVSYVRNQDGTWSRSVSATSASAPIREVVQVGGYTLLTTINTPDGSYELIEIRPDGQTSKDTLQLPAVASGSGEIAVVAQDEFGVVWELSAYDQDGRFAWSPEFAGLDLPRNGEVRALAVDSSFATGHRVAMVLDSELWILDLPESLWDAEPASPPWHKVTGAVVPPVGEVLHLAADSGLVALQSGYSSVQVFGEPGQPVTPRDPLLIGVDIPEPILFDAGVVDDPLLWPSCLANVGSDPFLRVCFANETDRELYITEIASPRPPDEVLWIGNVDQEPVKP